MYTNQAYTFLSDIQKGHFWCPPMSLCAIKTNKYADKLFQNKRDLGNLERFSRIKKMDKCE